MDSLEQRLADDPAQAAELTAAGLAPSNPKEAAIAATVPPGLYTALLSGVNKSNGSGLVEVYDRGAPEPINLHHGRRSSRSAMACRSRSISVTPCPTRK